MPKQEIDWDDEDAVRAARGDNPDAGDDKKEDEDDGVQDEGQEEESDAKEEEVEDEGKDKEEGKEKDSKKEPMIPKSRYDSKAAENRDLKERLERIEREKAAERAKQAKESKTTERSTIETEIDDLEDKYMEAIGKDEMDEAKRLRKEIRTKERQLFQSEISETSQETSATTREQVRLDLTIDHIEKEYPAFNPDSDDYDDALVSRVQELRAGFQATGNYTPTEALLKAIDVYMPKAAVKDIKDAGKDSKVDEERKKKALKNSVDAANKQPPDANGLGDDADALGKKEDLNIDKLSYEDIEKLPESTLKRLRGDFAA